MLLSLIQMYALGFLNYLNSMFNRFDTFVVISSILEFMGKKGVPPETFADNSIVDKLVREGFIDRLYKR